VFDDLRCKRDGDELISMGALTTLALGIVTVGCSPARLWTDSTTT